MEQALQLAASLHTLSSGLSKSARCPLVSANHLFSNRVLQLYGKLPQRSPQNTERENGSIPPQEAQRCHRPAVNRPAFVMLPAVRLAFPHQGLPRAGATSPITLHITLDNLICPLRFPQGYLQLFSLQPDLSPERLLTSGFLGGAAASLWLLHLPTSNS